MKFVQWGSALVATLSIGVTQAATPSPLITQAKKLIAAEMVDPSSLQYRSLRVVHGVVQGKALTIACGEYNSKNRLGGYTGYAKFAYEPTLLQGVVSMKADGNLDMFGNSGADRSDAATETKARIIAVCLGIKQ
jgi:hypothetical protein